MRREKDRAAMSFSFHTCRVSLLLPPNSKQRSDYRPRRSSVGITLRFFPFFLLLDRFLNHRQTSDFPTADGIFDVDQFEVQWFVQTETRLHVLKANRDRRLPSSAKYPRLNQWFHSKQSLLAAKCLQPVPGFVFFDNLQTIFVGHVWIISG